MNPWRRRRERKRRRFDREDPCWNPREKEVEAKPTHSQKPLTLQLFAVSSVSNSEASLLKGMTHKVLCWLGSRPRWPESVKLWAGSSWLVLQPALTVWTSKANLPEEPVN